MLMNTSALTLEGTPIDEDPLSPIRCDKKIDMKFDLLQRCPSVLYSAVHCPA